MILNNQQDRIDHLTYELGMLDDLLLNLLGYLEENDYYDDEELEYECQSIADQLDASTEGVATDEDEEDEGD